MSFPPPSGNLPFCVFYILDMPNENNDIKNLDLDQLIGNMSSINSEDYWFTKVSKIEEHRRFTRSFDAGALYLCSPVEVADLTIE